MPVDSRPLIIGLCIVLIVSLGVNAYLYVQVQQSPEVVYVDSPPVDEPDPVEPSPVVVYVSGAVLRPNVYTLPGGSRVVAAVEAAGGAQAGADLTRLNLARIIVDGEQIHIPKEGDSAVPAGSGLTTVPGETKVNINTATQQELETLPGIGPVKAGDIIAYRTQNGPFKKIADIMNVKGIGEKTFESLKDFMRIN